MCRMLKILANSIHLEQKSRGKDPWPFSDRKTAAESSGAAGEFVARACIDHKSLKICDRCRPNPRSCHRPTYSGSGLLVFATVPG